MNTQIINWALMVCVPSITGLVAYFMKTLIDRISKLEVKSEETISEASVRQILDDKILPLKEDLTEIKDSVKKLFDLYVKTHR